jgi:hypothetical protein
VVQEEKKEEEDEEEPRIRDGPIGEVLQGEVYDFRPEDTRNSHFKEPHLNTLKESELSARNTLKLNGTYGNHHQPGDLSPQKMEPVVPRRPLTSVASEEQLRTRQRKRLEQRQQMVNMKQDINQKVYAAYDTFNRAHALVPQPDSAYLVTNYSRPKGLKTYAKATILSEMEQTGDDRYSKTNLEKLNLMKRRQVLGSYKQS